MIVVGRRISRILAICALIVLAAPLSVGAAGIVVQDVSTNDYPEVSLELALTADLIPADGNPRFTILENGIDVPDVRAHVLTEDRGPVDVVLLLDVSGSMKGGPLKAAKTAARSFVAAMHPDDRIAVVAFSSEPRVLSGFTSDATALTRAIDALEAKAGQETALYDGLIRAARTFEDNGRDRYITVLSDGGDMTSINTLDAASAAVNEARAPVYAVALESPDYDPKPLGALATSSGGRLASVQDVDSLTPIFEDIAKELRSLYSVSFTSSRPSTKDLEIEILAKNGDVAGSLTTAVENPLYTESRLGIEDVVPPVPESPFAAFIVGALVLGAVGASSWALGSMLAPKRGALDQLRYYEQHDGKGSAAEGAPGDSSRGRVIDAIGYVADRRGYTGTFRTSLERAGLPLRVNEYIFFHLLFTLAIAGFVLVLTGNLFAVLIVTILAVAGPLVALQTRIGRRRAAFEEQLPDVLSLVAGSLRAGWGIQQAISLVVQEVAEPSATEFRRVESETRFGLPFEDALLRMADRLDSHDFRWTVAAITIQREVGGNLAEVLDIVVNTIRQRAELRRHVRALSAESRFSAIALSVMPFFAIAALSLVAPTYISVLFTSSLTLFVLGVGVLLLIIGTIWMIRLTKVEI